MHPSLIQHFQKFVSLEEARATELSGRLFPVSVKKKAYLLKAGHHCKASYFVEKGCLRLFSVNKKGEEKILQFAIENWWISDYMSLCNHSPAYFNIQAVEDSSIYVFESEFQEALLEEFPELEKYFRLVLMRAYAASQFRFKYLYEFSKEARFRHFTAHFPAFVQRVPQYMLASFLGLTPEYLSKIRSESARSVS